MSLVTASHKTPYYFVPNPSQYPISASAGLLAMGAGGGFWVNGYGAGKYFVLAGLLWLLFTLYNWFGKAIDESETGQYGKRVDLSFRWSMSWFIFSEVMFFAAFFGALFFARVISMNLLTDLDHKVLWPDFSGAWPTLGPAGVVEPFQKMGPWPIPTINTALLLTSGITLTIAHHALLAGNRSKVITWMIATLMLGFTFVGFQAYEYYHAYHELNLKLSSGIFGSTFYLLTGFHGFHVLMGAIMLTVVLIRVLKGHFRPDHHFAFEGAAWYWHFVDVVWIGLYVIVYWL
jgi:cytochrome c oxidase subunit III